MSVNMFIDRTNDFRQDLEEKVVITVQNNSEVGGTKTGRQRGH